MQRIKRHQQADPTHQFATLLRAVASAAGTVQATATDRAVRTRGKRRRSRRDQARGPI